MTSTDDLPADELDRIRFLVGCVFHAVVYLRYHWSSLPDRAYYTALLAHMPFAMIMKAQKL